MIRSLVSVSLQASIHARVAAQVVLIASRFRSSAYVRSSGGTASLTQLADLLALDIDANDTIEILVDGSDEVMALEALTSFLENATPTKGHPYHEGHDH